MVRAVGATKIEMTEPGQPVEHAGHRPLPPDQVKAAVLQQLRGLRADLFGDSASEEERELRWADRVSQVTEKSRHDRQVSDYLRLSRGAWRMEGVIDPKTGVVQLGERPSEPLPEGTASRERLEQLFPDLLGGPDSRQWDVILQAWEKHLPQSTCELLLRTGMRLEMIDEGWVPSLLRETLGAAAQEIYSDLRPEGAGAFYVPSMGFAFLSPSAATPAFLATRATHEVMHAVDWAMGEDGRPFSEGEEWRRIFDETRVNPRAERMFPTLLSQKNPSELFAESATVFLGLHVTHQGDVVTRQDLQENHPRLHALLEELFTRRIRQALIRQTYQPPEQLSTAFMSEARERYEREGSAEDALMLARALLQHGFLNQDIRAVDEAMDVLERAHLTHADPRLQSLRERFEIPWRWLAEQVIHWT